MDNGETNGPFVVGVDYNLGKGTIDLVSGPSLIMNAVPGTNDNSAFITYLINSNGTPDNILFDRANMPNAPLDTAKLELANLRKIMSEPYIFLSTIALVFVIITWYIYRRGLLIG
jgi:predicted permease